MRLLELRRKLELNFLSFPVECSIYHNRVYKVKKIFFISSNQLRTQKVNNYDRFQSTN